MIHRFSLDPRVPFGSKLVHDIFERTRPAQARRIVAPEIGKDLTRWFKEIGICR